MKILITGAGGQLGKELERTLPDGLPHHGSVEVAFTDAERLDITDSDAVQAEMDGGHYDFCINCAAYTAVDKAESDEAMAYKINADAVEILAQACAINNTRFIHISTDFVFDGLFNSPYQEYDLPEPLSVYGKSKLDGENRCWEVNKQAIIIRTSWLYSSYGTNFVKTMRRLGSEREQLNVIYDQVGTPTYARDLAMVIWNIVDTYSNETVPGIYHYSNEGVASWYDFAAAVMELSDIHCKVLPINTFEYPTPAKRPAYCILDKRKIKKAFGVEIPHWRTSLKNCIKLLDEQASRG